MPSAKPHYPVIHPTHPSSQRTHDRRSPSVKAKLSATLPLPLGEPHYPIIRPTLRTNSHDHPFTMPHALQSTAVDSRSTTAFGMPLVHSPLSLEGEQQLNALLKGGVECEPRATVKMNVDDLASGKNKTPFRQGQTRCDLRRA